MHIGGCTIAFNRLNFSVTPEEKNRTLLDIIEEASKYGLAGLELHGKQLERELHAKQSESKKSEFINKIKQQAVANALDLFALDIENNFIKPDPKARQQEVDLVSKWLDIAEQLGTPIVRIYGGRWGTISDFGELMERGGLEDPLPGHKYEEAIEWDIEGFTKCVELAKKKGITLAVENHWGITYSAKGVLDILNGVNSPWLKVAMDCGNFRENIYEQLEQIAPHTVVVHTKSYQGGGIFYELDLDYPRIIRMLKDVGYNGYLSIEYEGKIPPSIGIPAQMKILEEAIRQA